jgi:hypothetical protein
MRYRRRGRRGRGKWGKITDRPGHFIDRIKERCDITMSRAEYFILLEFIKCRLGEKERLCNVRWLHFLEIEGKPVRIIYHEATPEGRAHFLGTVFLDEARASREADTESQLEYA